MSQGLRTRLQLRVVTIKPVVAGLVRARLLPPIRLPRGAVQVFDRAVERIVVLLNP